MVNNDLRSLWKCMQGCAWCPNTACALTFAIIKTIPLAALLIRNWCWVWSVKNLNLSDRWDQIDATCAADHVVLFLLHCICHAKWSDCHGELSSPLQGLCPTPQLLWRLRNGAWGGGEGGSFVPQLFFLLFLFEASLCSTCFIAVWRLFWQVQARFGCSGGVVGGGWS